MCATGEKEGRNETEERKHSQSQSAPQNCHRRPKGRFLDYPILNDVIIVGLSGDGVVVTPASAFLCRQPPRLAPDAIRGEHYVMRGATVTATWRGSCGPRPALTLPSPPNLLAGPDPDSFF